MSETVLDVPRVAESDKGSGIYLKLGAIAWRTRRRTWLPARRALTDRDHDRWHSSGCVRSRHSYFSYAPVEAIRQAT